MYQIVSSTFGQFLFATAVAFPVAALGTAAWWGIITVVGLALR